MRLTDRRCVPCEGGVPALDAATIARLATELPTWTVQAQALERSLTFRNFRAVMAFVQRMADLAEAEGHHPDFRVHGYRHLDVRVFTHAIGGLSENDFVLAAKIEALLP